MQCMPSTQPVSPLVSSKEMGESARDLISTLLDVVLKVKSGKEKLTLPKMTKGRRKRADLVFLYACTMFICLHV